MRHGRFMAIAVLIATIWMSAMGTPASAKAAQAAYRINYWVERPNLQGNPGNPVQDAEAKANFMLYDQQTLTAEAGSTVTVTSKKAGEYLRTKGNQRRFADFLSGDEAQVSADGSTELNAYYVRGVFEYEFYLVNEQSEMLIDEERYTGNGKPYTVFGKYEEQVIVPGLDNGLMPKNTNASLQNIYCAGWALDERTGAKGLLTYANTIGENMLPTDDMPYEDLVFKLSGVWYRDAGTSVLTSWFEQLPEQQSLADVNRMTYNGKVYINYPATDYMVTLPKGSTPKASSVPGLKFVTSIDPDDEQAGIAGARRWQFLYERECYGVQFKTNGAGAIDPAQDVMFQQNLGACGPDWNEDTTRTSDGKTYRFAGWYTQGDRFVANSLNAIYMPAKNLTLSAKWDAVD